MQRRRDLIPLLILILSSASLCLAQSRRPTTDATAPNLSGMGQGFSIRGTVRLASTEQNLEMVQVDLVHSYGDLVATAITRGNGDFEFSGITPGNYALVIAMRGYEPVRENVQLNGSRYGVVLYMREVPKAVSEETDYKISQRELTLPRKARNAYRKGMRLLYEEKNPQGSLAQFQRAAAEFPGYYEAYHQIGLARMYLSQPTEAEAAFQKSIEISQGKYADPYIALGSLLTNNKKFAEAEAVLRRGLELGGNDWHGHYELARTLLGLDRLDAAEASAKEARSRGLDFPPVYLLLAEIHRQKRDYPALLQDLDQYLKLDPDGNMSAQAREMREQAQHVLAGTRNAPGQTPRQP